MSENTCAIAMEDLMDVDSCQGAMSGVKRLLLAPKDDVLTWPTLPASRTAPEDFVTLTGPLVMVTGKHFIEIQGDLDLTEFKIEGQGANNQVTGFRSSVDFNRSGLDAKALGTFSAIKIKQLAVLVLDNNGRWFLMGDKDRGAMLSTIAATSGKATTDQNGINPVIIHDALQPTIYTEDNIDVLLVPAVAS